MWNSYLFYNSLRLLLDVWRHVLYIHVHVFPPCMTEVITHISFLPIRTSEVYQHFIFTKRDYPYICFYYFIYLLSATDSTFHFFMETVFLKTFLSFPHLCIPSHSCKLVNNRTQFPFIL